jgi:ribosomal protein S18 acetylase RimI-like enzyme
MSAINLPEHPDYTLRPMGGETFHQLWLSHSQELFSDNFRLNLQGLYSDQELAASARLKANMGKPFRITWGLYYQDTFVGWTFGWQTDKETYYMCNSGIVPNYQRKGLYSAMLTLLLSQLTSEGFQVIFSRHAATNNAVLIPKLKAGFILSSFEISDLHGTLVHLRYYTNPTRRVAMDVRSGKRQPVGELATIFALSD